jgi:hypothetical protein
MKRTHRYVATLIALLAVFQSGRSSFAATYTATNNNAGWNTASTWDPNGIPGSADTAIIPSGKTVTYAGTPATIGTILISGTFTPTSAGTFGDVWVDTTGTLNITANGGGVNFSGNVTNLGSMPMGSLGSAAVYNYTGTGKVLAGNISNVIANITGSYQNVGTLVVGLKGNQNALKGSGTLSNSGFLFLANGQNTTSTLGGLDCSTAGNIVVWTNFIGTATPQTAPYYDVVLGHGGTAAWTLSAAGLTIANNLTVLQNGPISAWPANGSIGGRLIYSCVGNPSTLPTAFSVTALSQTAGTLTIPASGTLTVTGTGAGTWSRSGGNLGGTLASSTVKFTGAAPDIGGTITNRFANLFIDSMASASASSGLVVSNALTIAAGGSLDVTALSGGAHTMLGTESLLLSGTLKGSVATVSGAKVLAGTDGTYATGTVTGDLSMAAGSSINLDVTSTAGAGNDQLVVGGALALNSTAFNLKAPSAGAAIDTTTDYVLTTAASISGTPTLHWVVAPASATNYSVVVSGGSVLLHYTASTSLSTPKITSVVAAPGELHISGINGTPNGSYSVLGSINLGAPRSTWTTNLTGAFDGGGNFSFTNPISGPMEFFLIKQP